LGWGARELQEAVPGKVFQPNEDDPFVLSHSTLPLQASNESRRLRQEGNEYLNKGMTREAAAQYGRAERVLLDDSSLLMTRDLRACVHSSRLNRAHCEGLLGNHSRSVELYTAVLGDQPTSKVKLRALVHRSRALMRLGDEAAAKVREQMSHHQHTRRLVTRRLCCYGRGTWWRPMPWRRRMPRWRTP
jgi:hypothetical protein